MSLMLSIKDHIRTLNISGFLYHCDRLIYQNDNISNQDLQMLTEPTMLQLRLKMQSTDMEVKYMMKTVHRAPHKIPSELDLERNVIPGSLCAVICANERLLKGPNRKKMAPFPAQVTSM